MNVPVANMQKYLLLLLHCAGVIFADEWGYQKGHDGPSEWHEEYAICGHSSQSPVNINTNNTLPDAQLSMLKFEGYEQTLDGGEFINNGHSVQLNFPSGKMFSLSGGGMGDNVYTGLQLHFHWSSPGSTKGSEHTVNGHHYPVEMHIVHIKNPYTSTKQVKNMKDGLAVLGVFLEVGSKTNAQYQKLLDVAQSCVYTGSKATLNNGTSLISLLPKSASYYRYSGSLTTPSCYEAVTWTVFQEPVIISEQQLGILQNLKSSEKPESKSDEDEDEDSEDGLGGNYRPTQPLNGRIVSTFLDEDVNATEKDGHWSYHEAKNNPLQWHHSYPLCEGQAQSPINIQSNSVVPAVVEGSDISPTLNPITYEGYDYRTAGIFLNNGHSAQLTFGDEYQYTISDGGLEGKYKALQLHFHWGQVGSDGSLTAGSEHTIDGVRYPAELHIVHAKTSDLKDLNELLENSSDALAVLGILIDVGRGSESNSNEGTNYDIQMLFDTINELQYKDDSTPFKSGPSLSRLLPQSKTFYRYNGSLTTPPCYETVVWTVFKDPIIISLNQFLAFQQLFSIQRDKVEESNSIGKLQLQYRAEAGGTFSKSNNSTVMEGLRNLLGYKPEVFNSTISKVATVPVSDDVSSVTQYLIRDNYRPLQQVNDRSITVYIFEDDITTTENVPQDLPVITIVLFSVIGLIVFIAILAATLRCFFKKRRQQQYAAGKVTEDTVNL